MQGHNSTPTLPYTASLSRSHLDLDSRLLDQTGVAEGQGRSATKGVHAASLGQRQALSDPSLESESQYKLGTGNV